MRVQRLATIFSPLIVSIWMLQACSSVPLAGEGACQGAVVALDLVDQQPEATRRVPPVIPEDVAYNARRVLKSRRSDDQAQIEGEVKLGFIVNTDGSLCEIAVLQSSGDAGVDKASIIAVRQWRFKPAMLDGEAVRTPMEQAINYIIKSNT